MPTLRPASLVMVFSAAAILLSRSLSAASPDALDAAPARFATLDGMKVHYKALGSGSVAVVFVHGWSCDMTAWRAQIPAFDGKARVILVDLPGHGKSDRPEITYSMELFARAVEAVMKDAGVDRALLVGHSMGAPVLRQFWRLYPQKTLGLVAVEGGLRSFVKDPKQADQFLARFAGPEFAKTMSGFVDSMFVASTPEAVKAAVRAMMGSPTPQVAASAMKAMLDPAIWTDDPIGTPLEVIVAKSPMWSADYFAYLKTLNRGVEIHEVEGAGHFVMMEKPDVVNPLLTAFAVRTGVVPLRAVRPGRPEDVSSMEAIVAAVYDVISGPAGKKRDWDRMRSLFVDGARLIPTSRRPAADWGPRVLDIEGYIERSAPFLEKEGFFEKEVARRVETFGHIAQVFSTYEGRHKAEDPAPFVRGINSFQLAFDGNRWWVVSIFWEAESDGIAIPPKYRTTPPA